MAAFHDMNSLARQVDGRAQHLVLDLIIRRHGAPTFRQTLHKDALLRKNRVRQKILFPQLPGQDFTRRNHIHLTRIEQAVTRVHIVVDHHFKFQVVGVTKIL